MPDDLVSARIRAQFRSDAAIWVLAEIDRLWQTEGFAPVAGAPEESGQRRTQWRAYESAVDWSHRDHVRRALRVYESALLDLDDDRLERYRTVFRLDGWDIDASRRIVHLPGSPATLSGLNELRDAAGIRDALHRVELLLGQNAVGVVGASKELIESTAKTVLEARHVPYSSDARLPTLVKEAQVSLGLHQSQARTHVDGDESIRKILGGVQSVAIGLAELRNSDGAGHGRTLEPRLTDRHGRLAFNAARTWCEIVLDTLSDPDAPWRNPG